jgi:hypothetical protein
MEKSKKVSWRFTKK